MLTTHRVYVHNEKRTQGFTCYIFQEAN